MYLVYVKEGADSMTSAVQVIQSHLCYEIKVGQLVLDKVALPQVLASEAVHAVPLGLVGEHGGGEGDVPLQHAGEALLLVLAGGAVVHRPRHVRRAVPGNISLVELSMGLRKFSQMFSLPGL